MLGELVKTQVLVRASELKGLGFGVLDCRILGFWVSLGV